MAMILFNAFTGQWLSKTKLIDLNAPGVTEILPEELCQKSIIWYVAFFTAFSGAIQGLSSVVCTVQALGCKRFLKEGIFGMIPILNWAISVCFIFTKTQWAWDNPGLMTMLMMPSFCLINSKMIVCNFTKMETEAISLSTVYIMLFQMNKDLWSDYF
mmetsp:Transcript_7246/g.10159  ORF Transcript_7246/g.10159 Transcript_7246/m.10159 type:complete len:157 (+) Transcript_7246:606-1076(+)